MRLRCSSRTIRLARRGFTLVELLTAAALVVMLAGVVAGVMTTAGRLEEAVNLQTGADQAAVHAVDQLINDLREAKQVDVFAGRRLRAYFPQLQPDGHYDRFQLDSTHYVQYAQTDAAGVPDNTGSYLWRSTESDAGRAVARGLKQFLAAQDSPKSVRVTLHLVRQGTNRAAATRLSGRVLYLRNN